MVEYIAQFQHGFDFPCARVGPSFLSFGVFSFNSFYHLHLVFTHGNGAAPHFNGRKAGAAKPRVASLSAERSDLRIRLIIVLLVMLAVGS